ncbi:MAG: hypothetical protein RLZZ337_1777 [Bacteroidota bacterium]|jgi:ADP-heptose:LPS heptosyltransferase
MKILVIRFSSIGDIVITTPVVRCLRKQFPTAEIHYLTKPQFAGIIEPNPYVDQVILLKENLADTIAQLKLAEFDIVIDLHKNLRTRRIKWSLRKPWYFYNKLNFRKWFFVNFKINLLPKIHLVDRYFEGLRKLEIQNDGEGLDYFLPQEFSTKLADYNLTDNEYIAISIGGTYATKRMPKNVLQLLIKRLKLPVVLLGQGEDDDKLASSLCETNAGNITNLVGKLNLHQSAFIIKHAASVITGDTGLMHIAAAFKKNTQVVWGNTHPYLGMYAYASKLATNHQVDLACRPCSKLGSAKCPRKHFNCMQMQNWDTIVYNCNSIELTQ